MQTYNTVLDALRYLKDSDIRDDEFVLVHQKHCAMESTNICTCKPVKLLGKELKNLEIQ